MFTSFFSYQMLSAHVI